MNSKITAARIERDGTDRWAIPVVFVTIDGKEERLFDYYPDEIQFHSSEFLGLTREQGVELKLKKDGAYLRS